tara:strand:+ start:58 stop:363 length:306 start_codon:yes stop_codon:yes gene_type:complete
MTQPNKFAAALKSPKITEAPQGPPEASEPQIEVKVAPQPKRPVRRNTKHVGGYFDPAVSRQLRTIALEEDSTVQALLAEALDMLFQSRQRPTIAQKPVAAA